MGMAHISGPAHGAVVAKLPAVARGRARAMLAGARFCSNHPTVKGPSPDLEDLLAANQAWVREQEAMDETFFKRLGAKQEPKYLWIGCSDSRVPANQIVGLPPGAVFVHRNLGNVVANTDINCQSVIEFAVSHLDVQHIIVAGHYDCGAVAASLARQDLGLIEHWVCSPLPPLPQHPNTRFHPLPLPHCLPYPHSIWPACPRPVPVR